jgi:hypothetical protein
MPESRSRRLKQLEQRVEQAAPGKRDVFFMKVPRAQYEEALALLASATPRPTKEKGCRIEPSGAANDDPRVAPLKGPQRAYRPLPEATRRDHSSGPLLPTGQQPEAVEVQLEPEKVTQTAREAQTEEPDEFSDRARLKHLRDLSNASDRRNWHGENW